MTRVHVIECIIIPLTTAPASTTIPPRVLYHVFFFFSTPPNNPTTRRERSKIAVYTEKKTQVPKWPYLEKARRGARI